VLVDGQPRVACVTPTRRVSGRTITTLDGFDPAEQDRWASAFCSTGASQCGFCTPGIIVRLAGLEAKKPDAGTDDVHKALAAHLCRCTGWQTITEAWQARENPADSSNAEAGAQRASIEGRTPQQVAPAVALGNGGFADDLAPDDALVAVRRADGEWIVGETVHQANEAAGKIQGRRTTLEPVHPLELPEGDWAATLQTSWVEPAYLETDAAWARPGEPAVSPLANGGAFGAKLSSPVTEVAERLATEHGRPVRVLFSREDAIRLGPKRPPIAAGMRPDGTGVLRVVATPGIDEAITAVAPGLAIEHVTVPGELTTSADVRGAGWVEAIALATLARGTNERVTLPEGGWAEATIRDDGSLHIVVGAGEVLDPVVLRSYCIGAAHMATSMAMSESITVNEAGLVQDLTIRSLGIMRASDMPFVTVEIAPEDGPSVNGSDAVFAAVAAATSLAHQATVWPMS